MNKKSSNIRALLKRELAFMFRINAFKYIIIILFFIFINLILASRINSYRDSTLINFFWEVFKGVEYCTNLEEFRFPTFWLLINIIIIYIIGDYIQKDYNSNGIYVVTRCGKRRFWISKVIVSIINVITYYLIIFSITFIIGKIFTNDSLKLDYQTIILYITTTIMLVVFNSCISLFMDFKYSYLVIIMLLVLSVFLKSSLLPGQHSLILRHVPYDIEHGLSLIKSVIYNTILSITFIVIGLKFAKKKDIK